jgi:hypothetical protein
VVYTPTTATKIATAAAIATGERARRPGVRSKQALSVARNLLDVAPMLRRSFLRELSDEERIHVLIEVERETGSIYGLYQDDPVGFGEDVLGESYYELQKEVMAAVPNNKRTIVPAGFGLGKTHLAGRVAVWFSSVYPVGDALCVTTATRFRQVRNQLWPHIRRTHASAALPGTCLQTEWSMPDLNGVDTLVAYGWTAPPGDEAAMQGIHANNVLLIVEEAGGIDKAIGRGTNNLLTGDNDRMLAIGNPAADDPGTWFEDMAEEGDLDQGREKGTITIYMPVTGNPRITGEPSPVCRAHHNSNGHTVASHLPGQDWVDRTVSEYGEDHPYVISKVYARFPKGGSNKAIPVTWVEGAIEKPEPEGDGYMALKDLELDGENSSILVAKGEWVRLGVDVASSGGDEFVFARAVGDMVHQVHASAGSVNANAVDVAEKVLVEILKAQRLAKKLGSAGRVRVKIDSIGVGWGVYSMLDRWGEHDWDGKGSPPRHHADIVAVNVAEGIEADRDYSDAVMKPYRKRDELWLAGRALMQPDPETEEGMLRLRVPDSRTKAQFSTPDLSTNSSGFTVVEPKKSMKARGISSPDRAEAYLLAVYEPFPLQKKKRGRGILNGGRR